MTIVAQARRTRPVVRAEVAGLAGLPAGPALCAALARIDLAAVSGYELVLVLQARARQGNYERGMYVAAVAETMRRTDAEHGRLAEPELNDRRRWNIAELRAALVLTRKSAMSLGALAHDLSRRLPAVLAAMQSGRLDQPRARVFSTWTEQLADRHAQAVVEHLLPRAAQLTTGELIEAIQRAAIELDPRWARRRYETALRKRQVTGVLRPDGTADLAGTNLPADQVAAACDRIDALAHRLKQAGYPSLLTWIRADIYLGKLDGRYEGLTDEQLFTHLMSTPVPQPAPDPEPATPDDHYTEQEWNDYYDYLVEHGLIHLDDYDTDDDVDPGNTDDDVDPGNGDPGGNDHEPGAQTADGDEDPPTGLHDDRAGRSGDGDRGRDGGERREDGARYEHDEPRRDSDGPTGTHGDKPASTDTDQQPSDASRDDKNGPSREGQRGRDGGERREDADARGEDDEPRGDSDGPTGTHSDKPASTDTDQQPSDAPRDDKNGPSSDGQRGRDGGERREDADARGEDDDGRDGDGPAGTDGDGEPPDGPNPAGPGGTSPDRPDDDRTGGSGGGRPAPCPSTPDTGMSQAAEPTDPPPIDDQPRAGESGGVRGRGLRLLVGLTAIAGVDRRPGELLGFGFVHTELARRISAAPAASWHYALVRPDGTPIQVGPIRRRPTGAWVEGHIPDYRRLEVWLHLTPDDLARLTHDPPPGWATLITHLADTIATHRDGAPNGDPTARLPGQPLRRWLHLRDRRCVFPGCRVAPHRTDADHTIEHAHGGPTTDTNLGCLCEPDHLVRHEHGWQVRQTQPGRFTWTSPLGHTYHRHPPPGPADALTPMPRPTRHCEDRHIVWVNGDLGYRGTESCKTLTKPPPPPPPPPTPPGDPPF